MPCSCHQSRPTSSSSGSGSAGLTAALAAVHAGKRVIVVGRSDRVGGTAAISGGRIWIPGNPFMREQALRDSPDDALTYLRRLTLGGDEVLLAAFVEEGMATLEFLTEHTRHEDPDYQPRRPARRRPGRARRGDPGLQRGDRTR
ncbi:FAD-binding protein [Nocardia jiangxiensis]|uniref:FAD-binding protein n=1 Tax=Nocardia jiangxiensis TaxID=282685 RepID=A0ABW6SC59_9NOCA